MNANDTKVFEALVATFDILGAQAMFSQDTREAVFTIANKITNIFNTAANAFFDELNKSSAIQTQGIVNECAKRIRNSISTYFYGDTMVSACNLDNVPPSLFDMTCKTFITQIQYATYQMFESGLPVRGCLDCGFIGINGSIITGRPYVASIKNSDQLEFSGIVATDKFVERIGNNADPSLYRLVIPTKQGQKEAYILDVLDNTEFLNPKTDIRQTLFFSFFRHGKKTNNAVMTKLNNTEDIIRMMRQHRIDRKDEQRNLCI